MRKSKGPIRIALAGILLLSGCVALEDYERKVDEAGSLRREAEAAQSRVDSFQRNTDDLRKKIDERRLENEELAQSLSLARRHAQQVETRLADMRAQFASQRQDQKSAEQKGLELESAQKASLEKIRRQEENLVHLRGQLARFEDKLRFQEQVQKDLTANFAREIREGKVQIRLAGERVLVRLASELIFSSGKVDIKPRANNLLRKVAATLNRYTNREVQIQGHTDNIPLSDRLIEHWESNWELSAARATRVVRYLIEVGRVEPRRISGAGFGEYSPLADNATREGRSKNRRLEIVIFPPRN